MRYTPLDRVRPQYDVIVVGSGLGGLTSANRLAAAGHSVLLLEHHIQLGGLATWFKRGGHIFDVSLHGFPYGMVKTCKKYWGKAIRDSIVQLQHIVFDNPQFSLTTTFSKEDFIRILQERFGISQQVVEDFFATVDGMNFYDDQRLTTRELFEQFFPGRSDVHRLLMEPITYANGSTLDEPAITYGIVFSNFMNRGVFTFEGGTDKLIGLMAEELLAKGVDICTGARVDRILVKDGVTTGVVVGDREISARAVVSNAGVTNTIDQLVGRECFTKDFLGRFGKVQVNNSSCQVYFGIRRGETIPDIGDLLFTSTAPEFSSEEMRRMDTQSRTFSLYYPKTRPDAAPDYTIVASMNANYDDWAGLGDAAYHAAKEAMIERCLVDLDRYLPGIRAKIDTIESATPKTFHRYTLHTKGTSFGTKFEGLDISRFLHKEIGGLFHVGSVGIIMSGWLGAINYGVIVANDVDGYLRG
ncbi:fumarate reductase/succinate dehydrogenase flavoprotein domain protein [Desulfobulbus propionicus DSM 2032]|jgi:phytoene dehydrogenase-like protein|uniref:Fumarate reductase/succinate dehydrogenase flavoprotein domain protein n=1 Tax=Desulfobulbus propionicus (strain ATCC 33891 / DSM 2032 / VKM B-1956 / 1pr3) TaxID=577650 RepID=A0A7U3YP36_DESPD|nr:NAD(P)/FAD-dependent oxidoreductase [Desulfobulbus propionicus]ADW18803.1 fumarate reductase/succinate dehydrogenase flavoprotein domain protein [Desulfobulbus propionicus DSM 2032]